jgi:phospholipid transport system substrate-binding protein
MVNKIIFNKLLAVLILLALSVFYVDSAKADEAETAEPQVIVKDSTERMLQALKDNEDALEEDSSIIFGLVESIIMPHFDFNKMAKLALGRNWRKASSEQKEQFTEEFRLLLIRTYSTAMLEYTDEEIKFLPFRGELAKKKVKVPMEIIQPGGPSIPMALSMYLNKADVWKVYDVKIDGISLVTNYRSTFATQIRNEGMDKLIESLAKKNEKVTI